MKPLRLEVTAFGPYLERQVVDFRRLGESPLLLLWGPTGAGKTMLLDAVCYALFGECSGEIRRADSLRSQHAPPDQPTEVTLDFAVGDELYRVFRSPEWQRPRKRGAGTTTQPAQAVLWRRTGLVDDAQEGTVLAHKPERVTEKVEELLGFTSRQFRQVVVLPQGEFQKFLQASSRDREEILEVLFQTGSYRRLQELLAQRAREAEQAVRDKTQEQAFVLSQAGVASAEELAERLVALQTQLAEAQARALAAQQALDDAQQEFTEAARIEQLFQHLREAEREWDALTARQSEIERLREELAWAQKAAPLASREPELDRRRMEAQEAERRKAEAQQKLAGALRQREQTQLRLRQEQAREAEREEAQRRWLRLQDLVQQVGLLEQTRRRHAEAVDALQKWLAEQSSLVKESAAVKAAQQAAERARALAQERERQYEAAREKARQIEERWLAGQAAVLAARLVPGAPCPVCGSTEHPAPAQPTHELPSESEVAQARDDRQRAETAWRQALQDERRAAADSQQRQQAFAERQRELSQALTRAQAEADSLAALVQERAAGIPPEFQEPARLQAAIAEAERRVRQLQIALANAQTAANLAEAEVAASQAHLSEAEKQAARARSTFEQMQAEFDEALRKAGFVSREHFQAARRSDEQIAGLSATVRDYEQKLATARDRLNRAREGVEGLPRPDLAALQARLQAARQQWESENTALTHVRRDLEQAHDHQSRLRRLAEQLAALEQRQRIVSRLAQTAEGRNALRVSFQRYAQISFLERVLAAASERLRRMSKDRYLLRRAAQPLDRRETSGLDLEVLDAHTGQARRVSTLSGGESFMASLSLALGLSDVVQAYAGGLHLDSVFVDEGFGSLDSEALELAMACLCELQRTGRLVGIISHVDALREQISARLEVVPGRRGSTVRMVLP